jgi:hypothetical protein
VTERDQPILEPRTYRRREEGGKPCGAKNEKRSD